MSDRQVAVALRYLKDRDEAPRVVAKGRGAIAEKIMELARRHNVPFHKDADLVEVLVRLDLEELIPPEIYQAVAEVLAYLYRANQASGNRP